MTAAEYQEKNTEIGTETVYHNKPVYNVGLDVGSTTVKLVILAADDSIIFEYYTRHQHEIQKTILDAFSKAQHLLQDSFITVCLTGSAGISLSEQLELPFIQEVISSTIAIENQCGFHTNDVDVLIELGGEDAKMVFFKNGLDCNMNNTCAAGTGAFIDQMATLMDTDAAGLNDLAKNHKTIYTIASRCGVFAKTDIQPLLSEGARKEDIAMSIFQAVVTQTITGLACGRSIKGKVAFVGGPLHFLSELRKCFIKSLHLKEEEVIFPHNASTLIGFGAALNGRKKSLPIPYQFFLKRLGMVHLTPSGPSALPSLFSSKDELASFRERHAKATLPRKTLDSSCSGNLFLGIDAGSTTTKLVLIDEEKNVLYDNYFMNNGKVLEGIVKSLQTLYSLIEKTNCSIARCTITGYGEPLLRTALNADDGVVETVAHFTAAKYFHPDVGFLLDIGGQDMKCIKITNDVITSIHLNEACSSGCGSFIQTLSLSLGLSLDEFARLGLLSKRPVDLGTRCTVFMNSRVKQAHRDGALVEDISAGIAISVIKNALFKVIRISSVEDLGSNIVVQGGTFHNDAVLRAMEQISGKKVIRPDGAKVMGAFGAALFSLEQYSLIEEKPEKSSLLDFESLSSLSWETKCKRCGKCSNNCLLTVHNFCNGNIHVAGNRCERGRGLEISAQVSELPNLVKLQYDRVFDYVPLSEEEATRGTIGVPRALNMYEDYPFWHTVLSQLGFRVILSSRMVNAKRMAKGMETVPTEAVCYPIKMIHGCINELLFRGCETVFFPVVQENQNEESLCEKTAEYNCPLVTSYPEVIRVSMGLERKGSIQPKDSEKKKILHPSVSLNSPKIVQNILTELRKQFPNISKKDVKAAVKAGFKELANYKKDILAEGKKALDFAKKENKNLVVLACRSYHLDPVFTGFLSSFLSSQNCVIVTSDSIAGLHTSESANEIGETIVCKQLNHVHTLPSRIISAAKWAAHSSEFKNRLIFVHVMSFNCSLDATVNDAIMELLQPSKTLNTFLKIDQHTGLGAIRVRMLSLLSALASRQVKETSDSAPEEFYSIRKGTIQNEFDQSMKAPATLLLDEFSPYHTTLWADGFSYGGYNCQVVPHVSFEDASEIGLRYTNNDLCFGAALMIGHLLRSLLNAGKKNDEERKENELDPNNAGILYMYTGGACVSPNIPFHIRKALDENGLHKVRLFSLNFDASVNPKLNSNQSIRVNMGIAYGDLLMQVFLHTKAYAADVDEVQKLYLNWMAKARENLRYNPKVKCLRLFKKHCKQIVRDFEAIPFDENIVKPRVGIAGIMCRVDLDLMCWLNDYLEGEEECEVIHTPIMDLSLSPAISVQANHKLHGLPLGHRIGSFVHSNMVSYFRQPVLKALTKSKRFHTPRNTHQMQKLCEPFVSTSHQAGEGWVVVGHILDYLERGINNIVVNVPFSCLPSHITGRGLLKAIRDKYPQANICPIDYDAGHSIVNRMNRVKMMCECARRMMKKSNDVDTPLFLNPLCRKEDLVDLEEIDSLSACSGCLQKGQDGCSAFFQNPCEKSKNYKTTPTLDYIKEYRLQ